LVGIFDSGIGGLTVAHAVTKALPHESIVYFGDTAHLPYGDKSAAAIQAYSVKICDVLLQRQCKLILIACNSASAAAYDLVKEYVGSKARVMNVIDPVVAHVGQHFAGQTIGLIGTKQTVFSKVYDLKIKALRRQITLKSLATPLLAPMIEEGFFDNTISHSVIETYLNDSHLRGIGALILGCTHYPLIKNEIAHFYKGSVQVIDSSEIVADAVKRQLEADKMLSPGNAKPARHFLVSDFTQSFEASTKIFFGKKLHLEQYRLWE
jgi:glutamate racemase